MVISTVDGNVFSSWGRSSDVASICNTEGNSIVLEVYLDHFPRKSPITSYVCVPMSDLKDAQIDNKIYKYFKMYNKEGVIDDGRN